MLWHSIRIAYFIIWFVLLIHCLCSKRLFPILENHRLTKVLWCLTFVFLNPLLTLLYFIYGICLKPFSTDKKRIGHWIGSVIAIVMMAFILVIFEVPRPRDDPHDPMLGLLNIKMHAGILQSQNNFSHTFASSNHSNHTRFADQSIAIYTHEDRELLRRVAQGLQKHLVEQSTSRVVTITSLSESQVPKPTRGPDIVIRLGTEKYHEDKSPLGRKLDVTLTCQAGNSLYPSNYFTSNSFSPPILNFSFRGSQEHRSKFFGMESISAQYQQQADNIARELAQSLTKKFIEWEDEYGRLPQLPDYLYGDIGHEPNLTFPANTSAQLVSSGPDILTNNHSVWLMRDDRPTPEAFKLLRDHFHTQGFTGGDWLDNEDKRNKGTLHLEKAHKSLIIHRQQKQLSPGITYTQSPENPAPRLPLVLHYTSQFSTDQAQQALQTFLESETNLDTLLIFEEAFYGAELNNRFYTKLEDHPIRSARASLSLAHYYHHKQHPDQAKAAFLKARVLARLEKEHTPYQDRFKKLAKDLKDESLLQHPLALDDFHKAGFIDLTHQAESFTIEVPYHSPPYFCVQTRKGQIATVAMQFTPTTMDDGSPSYKFTRIVKTDNGSQTGSSNPYSQHVHVNIQDYGNININIKPISPDHFHFNVQSKVSP